MTPKFQAEPYVKDQPALCCEACGDLASYRDTATKLCKACWRCVALKDAGVCPDCRAVDGKPHAFYCPKGRPMGNPVREKP